MTNARMKWVMVMALALVLAPAAALAQHGHAPSPRPGEPAKDSPVHEPGEVGAGEDWFALEDLGDETFWDDDAGPGGPGGPHGSMTRGGRHGPGMRGMRHGRHGGMGIARRFAGLDLSEAQRGKLRDLHEAAMRKGVQRRADAQLARMDLHKLMRAENPSASAVNAQIDKVARLQSDGLKAHFDTYMQARALLTPEQRKQLDQGPAQVRQRRGRTGDETAK